MKKHLLLVDEDINELKKLTTALQDITGYYKCTYARSAIQGLNMLRFLTPDVVFANYDLSGTNGLQFLSIVRTDQRLKKIKFYLYSERICDDTIKMADKLDASGCINTPGAMEQLAGIFKKMNSSLIGKVHYSGMADLFTKGIVC